MARPGARPGDWKRLPLSASWAPVPCHRRFSEAEMATLRAGSVPQDMDDRWFVVWTGECLDFVRSWSGHTVFRAWFEPAPFGERVARALALRDDEVFRSNGPEGDAALLLGLCDGVLLQRGPVEPPRPEGPSITLLQGDLCAQEACVLVNAANEALAGGGGVDGALHRAAGEARLHEACRSLPVLPGTRGVRCPTGEARLTPAFDLRARWIAHAVGPVYGRPDAAARLVAAYDAALDAAVEVGAHTVALPAISCGVYGYPVAEAAPLALQAARRPRPLRELRWVLRDAATLAAFQAALSAPNPPIVDRVYES